MQNFKFRLFFPIKLSFVPTGIDFKKKSFQGGPNTYL